ncbi:MAG: stage III sporulation protein AD [Ruminococcus sp.]|nr:stage III sporulation protein AD [Ruminococcus sp.]
MTVLQIGIVGVLGTLLAVQFKSGKAEYGIYMSVAVSILLFTCMIDRLRFFVDTVGQISRYIRVDTGYIAAMLKMVGVTYIAEFCSGICKDAGYQTIATQVEIFSKLTILALGMPILLALLETIQVFLS